MSSKITQRILITTATLTFLTGLAYIVFTTLLNETPLIETIAPTVEPTTTPTPQVITINELDHTSFDSIAVIINKKHPLPEDYEPSDLVIPNVQSTKEGLTLRSEAANALETMFSAAAEDGITLILGSGYRSYETQARLFNNYVNRDGEEAANRYSARPGESEHQTGLAVDISDYSMANWLKNSFKGTAESRWLIENAYTYGFVLRYIDGKEDITGYIYEPWHYRYLGIEEAAKIKASNLTLEEYYNYLD